MKTHFTVSRVAFRGTKGMEEGVARERASSIFAGSKRKVSYHPHAWRADSQAE